MPNMYQYILTIDDYLNLFLFNLSRDKEKKKENRNTRLWLTSVFLIIGLLLLFKTQGDISGMFGVLIIFYTIYFFFNYPHTTKKQKKQEFILYIHDTYKGRFDLPVKLWLEDDSLCTKDAVGEYKFNLQKITAIDEIAQNIFIKTYSNEYIVIPKTIENFEQFKKEFQSTLNEEIPWNLALDWKW